MYIQNTNVNKIMEQVVPLVQHQSVLGFNAGDINELFVRFHLFFVVVFFFKMNNIYH